MGSWVVVDDDDDDDDEDVPGFCFSCPVLNVESIQQNPPYSYSTDKVAMCGGGFSA